MSNGHRKIINRGKFSSAPPIKKGGDIMEVEFGIFNYSSASFSDIKRPPIYEVDTKKPSRS